VAWVGEAHQGQEPHPARDAPPPAQPPFDCAGMCF
jgi:hypothetical protein